MKRKSFAFAAVLSTILVAGCVAVGPQAAVKPEMTAAAPVKPIPKPRRTKPAAVKSKTPETAASATVLPAAGSAAVDPAAAINEATAVEEAFRDAGGVGLAADAAEARPVVDRWEGTPPLALSTRDWGDAKEGFRYYAAMSRRALADGDPDAARGHALAAGSVASGKGETAEARALAAVAGLMEGKAGASLVAGLERPSSDWIAVDTIRKGISGGAAGSEVAAALAEVRSWPSPAAARMVRPLAAAGRSHPEVLAEVTGYARELDRAGMLGEGVLADVEGYVAPAGNGKDAAQGAGASPAAEVSAPAQMLEQDAAALLAESASAPPVVTAEPSPVEKEIHSAGRIIGEADDLIQSFEERIR